MNVHQALEYILRVLPTNYIVNEWILAGCTWSDFWGDESANQDASFAHGYLLGLADERGVTLIDYLQARARLDDVVAVLLTTEGRGGTP